MKRSGVPTIAWVLLGLLILAGGLLTLGQRDTKTRPSATSYGPSGTQIFAELLRRQGVPVVVDLANHPNLTSKDVAVCFFVESGEEALMSAVQQELDTFKPTLTQHLKQGGRAFLLPVNVNFADVSRSALAARPVEATRFGQSDKALKITEAGDMGFNSYVDEDTLQPGEALALWSDPQNRSLAELKKFGPGMTAMVPSGLIATNRFIDRQDNAEFLTQIVKTLLPPGGRVVFTEASFGGGGDTGLMESIGPWAEAGWKQVLLLFVVILYTLGKRFGLPEMERTKQRGQRELLDAVADTYTRAKMGTLALTSTYKQVDAELRRSLKLPSEATTRDRNDRLPPDVVKALTEVEANLNEPLRPDDATKLCIAMEQKVNEFLGATRIPARKGRRGR